MTQDNDNNDDKPQLRIEIAPGAFDNFDGTQEELDEMMAEIERMVEDGSLFEESEPINLEELFEEDPMAAIQIALQIAQHEGILDEDGNILDEDGNVVENIAEAAGMDLDSLLPQLGGKKLH